ncbi:MAG TPA: Asp-tRNA(Asn)/Glu-tRNA(Gln) amidotransferase subunit GatC [Thermoanaerobaculia bacterium]|jgi:aspartyl-tRNA(Asn)/glutamyl-tRNA(Gln) amidotransferase subunit C|nr:Asp-tRNA(Asn)/Glu-tRNA(Gln) amidotransferase subunit GatC [Thermoanaerobaculia bacterium]
MKIDRHEARRIADLAHLEFDDAGLERMADEMTTILGYIEMLTAVDTASAAEGAGAPPTPLREDVLAPSVDREKVARNAPAWDNGFFVVPAVIEGE